MISIRSPRTVATAALLVVLLAAAIATAYDWEDVGMDGVTTTCIAYDRFADRILVGTVEGFHCLDLATDEWTERDDEGWIGRQVHAIHAFWNDPDRILTGRENAFFKGYIELSTDDGVSGDVVHMSDGGAFVAFAGFAERVYACSISDITPGELLLSDDHGETWTPLTGHGMTAMTGVGEFGPLFVAGDAGIAMSEDDGETWTPWNDGLPAGVFVRELWVGGAGGDVLDAQVLAATDQGLWERFQFGEPWQQVVEAPVRAVTQLRALAPWPYGIIPRYAVITDDDRLLVTQEAYTWSMVDETGNLPGGLVDVTFSDLDDGLYVATASDGVHRVQHVVTAVDDVPRHAAVELSAWPNPFNPRVNVRLTLDRPTRGALRVYDVAGRRVATLDEGAFAAGRHGFTWDAAELPSGVYLAWFAGNGGNAVARLVLLR
jgi:hypothetical protein